MSRVAVAVVALIGLLVCAPPAGAVDSPLGGTWRGTVMIDNPRAKEPHIETKAALHVRGDGAGELFVERLGQALALTDIFRAPSGAIDLYTRGAATIELRNVRIARDRFDADAIYESNEGTVWQGRASFARVKPLKAPSGKPNCAGAPASLVEVCGAWSGISLRGQPKLLVVEAVARNKQKVAWELKVKQIWGGESDLASAGMTFPYTTYVTDEELPLASLVLRTTGKVAYKFDLSEAALTGGSISDSGDRTVYTKVAR